MKRTEWVCALGKCSTKVATTSYAAKPEERPVLVEHYCRGEQGRKLTKMAEWPHADGGG